MHPLNMAPTTHTPAAIFLLSCALTAAWFPAAASAGRPQITCEVGTTSIRIQEEFVNDDGSQAVYCRGAATVNKCEGQCSSMSRPSIATNSRFVKVCNCCRENRLVPRDVILTDCYDGAGNALLGQSYVVQVPEPETCRCQRCSL